MGSGRSLSPAPVAPAPWAAPARARHDPVLVEVHVSPVKPSRVEAQVDHRSRSFEAARQRSGSLELARNLSPLPGIAASFPGSISSVCSSITPVCTQLVSAPAVRGPPVGKEPVAIYVPVSPVLPAPGLVPVAVAASGPMPPGALARSSTPRAFAVDASARPLAPAPKAEWDAAVLREKLERIQDEVHGIAQTQQTSSELERTRQHVSEVLGSLQQQQRQVLEAQERHEEMGALERQQRQWAQEKVAELGGKLKEKDRKILDMGNSLKRTKKRLEELIEETERRKRSLARVEKDRERAATARERLEEQRDQLEEELRSVQQSGEAARVRCEQLQRRCHELERRDQEQRQDISLAEQGRRQEAQELENSEVRRLKALHEAELEDLRGKHSKVLLSIQAERNALTKERQVLEEQLHSVAAEQRQEAESQAERARLCEELSGRLMNAKDAVQRLEEEKRSLQTEARDAQAEHDRLREQRDELARRLRGVEEARRKAEGDRQSMQQELGDARSRAEDAEREARDARGRAAQLQDALREAREAAEQAEDDRLQWYHKYLEGDKENASIQRDVESVRKEVWSLEAQLQQEQRAAAAVSPAAMLKLARDHEQSCGLMAENSRLKKVLTRNQCDLQLLTRELEEKGRLLQHMGTAELTRVPARAGA